MDALQYPSWGLVAYAGSLTLAHHDSGGLSTFITECMGVKYWFYVQWIKDISSSFRVGLLSGRRCEQDVPLSQPRSSSLLLAWCFIRTPIATNSSKKMTWMRLSMKSFNQRLRTSCGEHSLPQISLNQRNWSQKNQSHHSVPRVHFYSNLIYTM